MPGHLCRSAVRALAASLGRLFWEVGINPIGLDVSRPAPRLGACAPARLVAVTPARRRAYLTPSPPRTCSSANGNGISTVCPSPTRFRLGLGPTNPTWMYLPSETLGIRWGDFSSPSRYSCRHSLSCALHRPLRRGFVGHTTLPYRCVISTSRSFGTWLEPRYIVGAAPLDQ